jgi:GntR family transcriptional regulator/MocR family aminotransferase
LKIDFQYDKKRLEPVYIQLSSCIKDSVDCGKFKPGFALPPSRELAVSLNLSRDTVTNAYRELARLGYIGTDSTRRTYVLSRDHINRQTDYNAADYSEVVINELSREKLSRFGKQLSDQLLHHPSSPNFAALNYGAVPRTALPLRRWRELLQNLCLPETFKKLEYEPNVMGRQELRAAIADYVSRTKNISCDWEQVAIFSISSGTIDVLCRLLLEPGAVVAVEEPGYGAVKNIAKSHGLNLLPVRIDREGMCVEDLRNSHQKISMVYVTAAHHDPSGVIMSAARRKELLAWSKTNDVWIVEDDYDGHFYYAGQPPPSIWSLNPNDNVIYSSTFWQVLYPLTATGYAVLPKSLVSAVRAAKEMQTKGISDYLVQMVLTEMLEGGYLEKHLRRVQKPFASRRIALIHELKKHLGASIEIQNESAGNYFVFVITEFSALSIETAASLAGLPIASTATYYLGNAKEGEYLINFALLEEEEIRERVVLFSSKLKMKSSGSPRSA